MRALLVALLSTAAVAPGAEPRLTVPDSCRQAVVVSVADWDAQRGTLRRFARAAKTSPWVEVGHAVDAVVGDAGLAWGLGLPGPPATGAGPVKREGDRRAPAGVFALTEFFGHEALPRLRLPFRRITPELEAIDDPASRFYNRLVARSRVEEVDWRSSEKMAQIAEYALGIVVGHNPRNVPGAGSCIFIHQWLRKRGGTMGCTALAPAALRELALWLDGERQPVLVQGPAAELPAPFRIRPSRLPHDQREK